MGESNGKASWNEMGQRSQESMEGYRRKPRRDTVRRLAWGLQDGSKSKDINKAKANAKKKIRERGGTLKRYTGG